MQITINEIRIVARLSFGNIGLRYLAIMETDNDDDGKITSATPPPPSLNIDIPTWLCVLGPAMVNVHINIPTWLCVLGPAMIDVSVCFAGCWLLVAGCWLRIPLLF